MRLIAPLALSALVLIAASPALSQEDSKPDWDLSRDENGSLVAYTTYDTGLSLGFRCKDGAFAAVAAGLPHFNGNRRPLMLRFGDREPFRSMWTNTTNETVAVADYPAPLARKFRQGGPLRLTAPGGAPDGRDLTYAVVLPSSNVAIDTVLTECGRPLNDPRDALLEPIGSHGLSGAATWARAPRVQFPNTFYASGFAVLTCLAWPDGSTSDCVVESEHPHDGRFGEAALRGARRARVAFDGEAPERPIRVGFYVGFRVSR